MNQTKTPAIYTKVLQIAADLNVINTKKRQAEKYPKPLEM